MDRNVVDRRAFALKCVALRKESVDRNVLECDIRRNLDVALRKESVDRNSFNPQQWHLAKRRSPQGERG